jgi:hypothetical protein
MRARVLRIVATSVVAIGPPCANAGDSKVFEAQAQMWCRWSGVAQEYARNPNDSPGWIFGCTVPESAQNRQNPSLTTEGLLHQDGARAPLGGLPKR